MSERFQQALEAWSGWQQTLANNPPDDRAFWTDWTRGCALAFLAACYQERRS